jgi:hypothetical protein
VQSPFKVFTHCQNYFTLHLCFFDIWQKPLFIEVSI